MFSFKYIYILIFTVISFLFISCKDDDSNPLNSQEDHYEAEGMVFYTSGIKLAEIFQGVTTDTLTAPAGGLGDHIDIKFYDGNKTVMDPPSDEDHSLSWEISNTSLLSVFQHDGEEGSFEFHLKGLAEGTTNIEFFIKHEDHNDFRSGKIPVKIINEADAHGEPVGLVVKDEESDSTLVTVTGSAVSGSLTVSASDSTDHREVEFFDDNNVYFQPEVPPHSLNIVSSDENIFQITGLSDDEPWAFKIKGIAKGTANLTLSLAANGTIEKTFLSITVIVE